MLLVILIVNKLLERFTDKKKKKKNRKSLALEKQSREKGINYMSNEKVMIILLTVGLIEMILLYKTNYFP